MEEQEIENKIAQKISEAKLDIIEKRFQHFMWFCGIVLAVVGVIIPIYNTIKIDNALTTMKAELSNSNALSYTESRENYNNLKDLYQQAVAIQNQQALISYKRVDDAVQDMQKQFKELAGNQLKRPIIECFVNGKELDTSIIIVSPFTFKIKNIGDGAAKNITIKIHINSSEIYFPFGSNNFNIQNNENNTSDIYTAIPIQIDPKDFYPIPFDFCSQNKDITTGCIMKIFYEQPEPKSYVFKIKFKRGIQ
jgi:hypothetical protein